MNCSSHQRTNILIHIKSRRFIISVRNRDHIVCTYRKVIAKREYETTALTTLERSEFKMLNNHELRLSTKHIGDVSKETVTLSPKRSTDLNLQETRQD